MVKKITKKDDAPYTPLSIMKVVLTICITLEKYNLYKNKIGVSSL